METFSKDILDAARGITPADAVVKNGLVFNPFINDWERGDLAIKNGLVLGIGTYTGKTDYDLSGSYIIPGLIDAHVHIESSLLAPREYARLVALHGTTTVIADPHEIANVAGKPGIDFMLAERSGACLDIRYLLPSCVPATLMDMGGATLDAHDLQQYIGCDGILGLGEMMNVPGVLTADPAIGKKLRISLSGMVTLPCCVVMISTRTSLPGSKAITNALCGMRQKKNCGAGCIYSSVKVQPNTILPILLVW